MCMKPQKQQKNIIHSDIRNILNPVSILFWTRIGTLPSVDSRVTSVNQPLTPTSNYILDFSVNLNQQISFALMFTVALGIKVPVFPFIYSPGLKYS